MSSQGYYNDGRPEQGSWGGYNQQQQYPLQPQYGEQQSGYPPQNPSPYIEQNHNGPPLSEYPLRSHSPYEQQPQYSGTPSDYPPRGHSPYAPPPQYDVQQQEYPPRGSSPYDGGYNRPPPGEYSEGYPGNEPRYSPRPGYGEQQGYAQGYPPPGQEGYPGPGQEGERGFLGAVAGGAAGAFGGHKLGHGVLGGIGGAVAGSMAQDHFKHKKEEERKHEQQQQMMHQQQMMQQQQQQQAFLAGAAPARPHHGGGNFRGNFSSSSTQISLDRDYDLIASCGDVSGHNKLTSISLNDCLSNEFGNFRWSKGGNFGATARNVRLVDGGRVLEAELGDGGGGWKRSHVFLDERITNDNGDLRFLD